MIGTWNVSSLTGKDLELVEEAARYRLDIVGISSTKQKGSRTVDLSDGWKLFLSGVAPQMSAQAGVGILTSPRLADRVLEWIPLGVRVGILKLKLERSTLALVQVYAPNLESEYAAFLDEVDAALDRVAEMDSYILMGDFNAHVGVDVATWGSVIGRNGDPHQNANGEKLLDFCCANGMSIMNTFFSHKGIHKYTWYRQSLRQKSLIDLFVVPSCVKRMVCDVRVKRGAELSTDHHLVLCTLYLANTVPLLPTRKPRVVTRIRWEKLQNSEVQLNFARHISERFERIPTVPSRVEEEWQLFSTAIIASARDVCGVKRLGVAAGGEKRTAWFKTPGVQEAIREKKKTYRDWILLGDSASRNRYTEARRTCKLAVRAAKEQSWKEFGEKLESDHRSAKKVFWQTIRRLRGRKFNIIEGVESKDGVLLSNEVDILRRWSEHFSELLNPE
jgi:hypothetical protein